MSKKKKRINDEELNFWQPASDMFSALLLTLMLVILLLGLYVVHIPEHSEIDPWSGDSYAEGADETPDNTLSPEPTIFIWIPDGLSNNQDNAAADQHSPTPLPTPTPTPTPTVSPTPDWPGSGGGTGGGDGGGNGEGEGPGEEPDVGAKSAVYVMLIDEETERAVKEANVEFELYSEANALQILNTYYPDRISYRMYETTETGTFYFPEKLMLGKYHVRELTEPADYDAAENVSFTLEEAYDWPEPYVVRVPVKPSRNIIRVQLTDYETGKPLSGGSFDVVAAENIITSDGTLRYRNGQIVGQIECDSSGYGVSEEIFLGNYLLRQRDIPDYYAGINEDIEVTVEKKAQVLPQINNVACKRMRIHFSLTDELYADQGIGGASFRITAERGSAKPVEVYTDSRGRFTLDELERGVTYRFHQLNSAEHYLMQQSDQTVFVDALGYMDGETETDINATNRMIRVMIGIVDEFSKLQVSDVNMALYESNGTMVRTWISTGNPVTIYDLTPGSYYLVKDGNADAKYGMRVVNTAELQTVNLQTTYVMLYATVGASAVALLGGGGAFTIMMIRHRKKKKALREAEQGNAKSSRKAGKAGDAS